MEANINDQQENAMAREKLHTPSAHASAPALQPLQPEPKVSSDASATSPAAEPLALTTVTFQKSGKVLTWAADDESILEFAEKHGIDMDYGCRYGDCATCMTPLLQGRVIYNHAITAEPDPGTCLPCSCRPDGSVTIDA